MFTFEKMNSSGRAGIAKMAMEILLSFIVSAAARGHFSYVNIWPLGQKVSYRFLKDGLG